MAKKILVIDDEPALLFLVSHGLKKRGYEVFSGRDGREALDLAARVMPDLVILDLGLPLMNGDEVARILKNDEKMKHIPVFLISSIPEGLSEKYAACGADACLSKPFCFDELYGMINKYLSPSQPPAAP